MKIRPVATELFRTDKRDEANSHFSQVCERPYTLVTLRPLPPQRKINSKRRRSLKSAAYLIDPKFKDSEVKIKYECEIIQTLQCESRNTQHYHATIHAAMSLYRTVFAEKMKDQMVHQDRQCINIHSSKCFSY
jgi:hypothetical protein